jgi:hypothetical protein
VKPFLAERLIELVERVLAAEERCTRRAQLRAA